MSGIPFERQYTFTKADDSTEGVFELVIPGKATLTKLLVVAYTGTTVVSENFKLNLYNREPGDGTGVDVFQRFASRIIGEQTAISGYITYLPNSPIVCVNRDDLGTANTRTNKIYAVVHPDGNGTFIVTIAGYTPVL